MNFILKLLYVASLHASLHSIHSIRVSLVQKKIAVRINIIVRAKDPIANRLDGN